MLKEFIKNNKIIYLIFNKLKAYIYHTLVLFDKNFFDLKRFLQKKGYIKEDNRFLKIKSLKDKYKGQRCFIVATGPSVTIKDLELLKDEYTISMNSIVNVLDKTAYRPDIYMIQDKTVYNKLDSDKFELLIPGSIYVGINNMGKYCHTGIKKKNIKNKLWNLFYLDSADIWYDLVFNSDKYKPSFSDDCYDRIMDGTSIVYSCIQLAAYMGFKDIYLIGVDCNFKGKIRHIGEYDESEVLIYADEAQKNLIKTFKVVKGYLNERKINLYNATRGGNLEVLPRVKIEEVLK